MLRQLCSISFLCFLFISSTISVRADEHFEFGKLISNDVSLDFHDHTFAGKFKDALIWGEAACKDAFAILKIRLKGETREYKVLKNSKGILSISFDGKEGKQELSLLNVDQKTNTISYQLNGDRLEVRISSDTYHDGHFINPTYSFSILGKDFSYTIDGGEACYGLSVKLSMMLISATVVTFE